MTACLVCLFICVVVPPSVSLCVTL